MSRDYSRFWTNRGIHYHLLIRRWGRPGLLWWHLRAAFRRLWLDRPDGCAFGEFWLRTWHASSSVCYCPTGNTSLLRLEVLGFGMQLWLGRDWTRRPCHCDQILWLLSPDNHWDEIEEYGPAKLRAEYQDLWKEEIHG